MPSVIATTFTAQELCDLLAPEIARRVADELDARCGRRRQGRRRAEGAQHAGTVACTRAAAAANAGQSDGGQEARR